MIISVDAKKSKKKKGSNIIIVSKILAGKTTN